MTLGCQIIAHNLIEHDYCIHECVSSVAPICDQILIVECDSSDGTQDLLAQMSSMEPKIKVIRHPWKPSRTGLEWITSIYSDTKSEIGTDWYIGMDADEIILPSDYPVIQDHFRSQITAGTEVCGTFIRRTFWKDSKHILPNGTICNHLCHKLVPKTQTVSGDLIEPPKTLLLKAEIYHYGHIRLNKAWAKKCGKMQDWAFGKVPECWTENPSSVVPDGDLIEFHAQHPMLAHQWLLDRGYTP
ncbi:MAG: glycosyltransferase family 2 protein [Actinomycetes bacterium]